MKFYVRIMCIISALMMFMFGCGMNDDTMQQLDPKDPVNITIWHYYNGVQKMAFDRLVEEFNQTVGSEYGIYVQAHSQGSVRDLERSVLDSFHHKVGSKEIPDIFSSYADTVLEIEKMGMLVDLSDYLKPHEIQDYIDSFIEEGKIGTQEKLRIFPIAKSSEIFMMNMTAWIPFAEDTGRTLDDLATLEGVAETAKEYYEWTDRQTPDIPNDGKAFFGRDAMANLFIIGSMQLGIELFSVKDGKVEIQVDDEVMRRIWNTYYVPYISGYFSSYGRFRSDDLKIGEIIAYTGSTSSASYFPDKVESEGKTESIDYIILPAPLFRDGKPYAVQQGAGMVVTKSTPVRELASVIFLKWFTQEKNNITFCSASGYMPVKRSAMDRELMQEAIDRFHIDVSQKFQQTLETCFETVKNTTLYTSKAFHNGVTARSGLETHLQNKAVHDREIVRSRLANGQTLEQAIADLSDNMAFYQWLSDFKSALNEAAYVA